MKSILSIIIRSIHVLLWGKYIQKTEDRIMIWFSKSNIEIDKTQTIIHFDGVKNVGHINRVLSEQEIQNINQDNIRQWLNKGR